MPQPTATAAYEFSVRVSPAWDAVLPAVKRRAEAMGLTWPKGIQGARLPRVWSLLFEGQQGGEGGLSFRVRALQPPREDIVLDNLTSFAAAQTTFGFGAKRPLAAANDGVEFSAKLLAVHIDEQGLYLPDATAATPASGGDASALALTRLTDIPMANILQIFHARARGALQLKRTAIDHIVESYASPPGLEKFAMSWWRGENFQRLSTPMVRLEVSIRTAAARP